MSRNFGRLVRYTVYRASAAPSSGFIYKIFDRLVPNGIEITEVFGMEIDIEKTSESKPNTALAKIFNLNEDTRAEMERTPLSVRIEAGYEDEYRLIFQGDVIRAYSQIKGPTWETVMQLGDGSRALRYGRVVPRGYPKGTSVLTMLRDCAESIGISLPENVEVSDDLKSQFASGGRVQGLARDEINRLIAPYGYSFSIQDGRPVILRDSDVQPGSAIVVDDSWLIGSPEYETPTHSKKPTAAKFDTQLYPEIGPGKLVQLTSRSMSMLCKVLKVKHTIRTESGDFKSAVEARAL